MKVDDNENENEEVSSKNLLSTLLYLIPIPSHPIHTWNSGGGSTSGPSSNKKRPSPAATSEKANVGTGSGSSSATPGGGGGGGGGSTTRQVTSRDSTTPTVSRSNRAAAQKANDRIDDIIFDTERVTSSPHQIIPPGCYTLMNMHVGSVLHRALSIVSDNPRSTFQCYKDHPHEAVVVLAIDYEAAEALYQWQRFQTPFALRQYGLIFSQLNERTRNHETRNTV